MVEGVIWILGLRLGLQKVIYFGRFWLRGEHIGRCFHR